jgi:DNA end-binding protein Ku
VAASDIVKGYETGDGEYILLDPDEIDAIKLETKKTFELVQFVGACEISPLYFDKPYYLVPADDLAADAYRVVRDALRASSKTGLGQITLRGKEYLAAVRPCGDGLLMETLHYADELQDSEPLFSAIEDASADADLLEVATSLIDRKTSPFDAAAYVDHYSEAMQDLLDAKRRNKSTRRVSSGGDDPEPRGENVVDLMAALKDSLKAAEGRKKAAPAKAPAKAVKPAARKKAS